MTHPDVTCLDERIWRGDQSLCGTRIVRVNSPAGPDWARRYRARIVRDAYSHQCIATAETWHTGRGWDEVVTMPIENLPIFTWHYTTQQEGWRDAMRDSLTTLCTLAQTVLA